MSAVLNVTALRGSASLILRLGDGLAGHRLVTDDAATLCVRAFPFVETARTAASTLGVAAAYVLADPRQREVYVGETGNLARRLQEHSLDPAKNFATEVFALVDRDGQLDKPAVIHLQKRVSEVIREAGVARLIAGVTPCSADLPEWRRSTLDRMLEAALPLLFDAGCRCVVPQSQAAVGTPEPVATAAPSCPSPQLEPGATIDEEGDEGPMEIGVTTTPIGVQEVGLSFFDLWARGYEHGGKFVVAAGSEMRRIANPSANAHTLERRQGLIESGAATMIDGMDDRLRLQVAVAFPSRAIAAKVLCGAHVGSEKWRPLSADCPYVIAT